MPNVMAVLPNIGGVLCSMQQSLPDAHYKSAVSNAAKTQNPLKLVGVPKTRQQISAVSAEVHHILRTCGGDIAVEQVFF